MLPFSTPMILSTCDNMRTDEVPVYNTITNEYEGNVEITSACGNELFTPDERAVGMCVACQRALGVLR